MRELGIVAAISSLMWLLNGIWFTLTQPRNVKTRRSCPVVLPAVSNGGRNSVKYFARFHPLKSLSRPGIELPGHSVQICLGVRA